jgi:hypothetical protein
MVDLQTVADPDVRTEAPAGSSMPTPRHREVQVVVKGSSSSENQAPTREDTGAARARAISHGKV